MKVNDSGEGAPGIREPPETSTKNITCPFSMDEFIRIPWRTSFQPHRMCPQTLSRFLPCPAPSTVELGACRTSCIETSTHHVRPSAARGFRVLGLHREEMPKGGPPLHLAHVQLLSDRAPRRWRDGWGLWRLVARKVSQTLGIQVPSQKANLHDSVSNHLLRRYLDP